MENLMFSYVFWMIFCATMGCVLLDQTLNQLYPFEGVLFVMEGPPVHHPFLGFSMKSTLHIFLGDSHIYGNLHLFHLDPKHWGSCTCWVKSSIPKRSINIFPGLGIDVPFWGLVSHHQNTYLEMENPLFSWVMFNWNMYPLVNCFIWKITILNG